MQNTLLPGLKSLDPLQDMILLLQLLPGLKYLDPLQDMILLLQLLVSQLATWLQMVPLLLLHASN